MKKYGKRTLGPRPRRVQFPFTELTQLQRNVLNRLRDPRMRSLREVVQRASQGPTTTQLLHDWFDEQAFHLALIATLEKVPEPRRTVIRDAVYHAFVAVPLRTVCEASQTQSRRRNES